MKQFLVIVLLLVLQMAPALGQDNTKASSAIDKFNEGDMEQGIKMMSKIKDNEPTTENWDILVGMYYQRYLHERQHSIDQLAKALLGDMSGKKRKKGNVYYLNGYEHLLEETIAICLEAGLYSQSQNASQILRNYFIDYDPDTAISERAKEQFKMAEDFFNKKDFKNARFFYKEALEIEPGYYKAIIYLGDSYWYLRKMDSAIYYFNKGIEMCPDLLEPRKYLVDALAYSERNEGAEGECYNALSIYPDEAMYIKLNDLVETLGGKFDRRWVARGCEVNAMGKNSEKVKDKMWAVYQEAKDEIETYCDSNGVIVKPNSLTTAKYLEVYSWAKMLDSNEKLPGEMAFARKMANEGFLDCYVFFSVFHFDLYDQYMDFIKNNKERVRAYAETYLIE